MPKPVVIVRSNIHQVAKAMIIAAELSAKTAAEAHAEEAIAAAPVSADGSHGEAPGFLRDNIVVDQARGGGGQFGSGGWQAQARAFYSGWVNFGTRFMEAIKFWPTDREGMAVFVRDSIGQCQAAARAHALKRGR